jgi:hypothetical protein
MEDDLYALASLCAGSRIGQIALDEVHGFEADQIGAFPSKKVVDATNRFATRQESRGNGATNKAGCAGDEIFSQCLLQRYELRKNHFHKQEYYCVLITQRSQLQRQVLQSRA